MIGMTGEAQIEVSGARASAGSLARYRDDCQLSDDREIAP
jgi:hypothetical protein